jgi:hypothetical protein
MNLQKLAERFCAAPLPETVCVDACTWTPGCLGRTGTNLLTVEEAKVVLDYVLEPVEREMGRDTVYNIIDGERDHQDAKWGCIEDHPHEVGGWILIMESLLADARKAWQSKTGDRDAMSEIRKVIAVGVAAMEQHGAPRRQ